MKKMLTKFISETVSIGLIALLGYSIWKDLPSMTAIAASAYWIVIALAIFVGAISCIGLVALGEEMDPEKRKSLTDNLTDMFKKPSAFRKCINWIALFLIVGMLAYTGWVFTAVCYMLVSLLFKFIASLGREKLEGFKDKIQA